MVGRFLANLENHVALTDADRAGVAAVLGPPRAFKAGADLVEDGDDGPDVVLVLLSGQAFRHQTLPDGRRQILSFHAPGDVLDLPRLFMGVDYSVGALSAGEAAPAPRAALLQVMADHPRVAQALWKLSLVEAAIYRAWLVGVGRRTAHARIAHLLCEVFTRLEAAGEADGWRCPFPATQIHLSDSLGLSVVHTNRVLRTLEREGLVSVRGREIRVRNWAGLMAAGEFDAGYLQLPARVA